MTCGYTPGEESDPEFMALIHLIAANSYAIGQAERQSEAVRTARAIREAGYRRTTP